MSQKTNPKSTRIFNKKPVLNLNSSSTSFGLPNRQFESCWYSDIHYNHLLTTELNVKYYINAVVNQLYLADPVVYLKYMPKKAHVYFVFLNTNALRIQRQTLCLFTRSDNSKEMSFSQQSLSPSAQPLSGKTTGVFNSTTTVTPCSTDGDNITFLPTSVSPFTDNIYNKEQLLSALLLKPTLDIQTNVAKNLLFLTLNSDVPLLHKQEGQQHECSKHIQLLQILARCFCVLGFSSSKTIKKTTFVQQSLSFAYAEQAHRLHANYGAQQGRTSTGWCVDDLSTRIRIKQQENTPHQITGVEHIQRTISKNIGFPIQLTPISTHIDSTAACFVANEITYYLQQRVSHTRIIMRLFSDFVTNPDIKGIRITFSGRLSSRFRKAQQAKTLCIKVGQTSLHVFSSKIDFAQKNAMTSFGWVGVKVWLCYKS